MKIKTLLSAACFSALLLAGCSSAADTSTTDTAQNSTAAVTEKTDSTTSSKDTSSSKDTTSNKKADTQSSATEEETSSAGSQSQAKTDVDYSGKIGTITKDLKNRGYYIQNETVDWDNGINAKKVKQEIECDGIYDYNIWQFDTEADASSSFDNIEAAEKLDYDNSVDRDGNLITITDKEDGDKEYYVLSGDLIVESDSVNAISDFQTWGLY